MLTANGLKITHDVQVVSQPDEFSEAAGLCQRMRNENVVKIVGKVRQRQDPNPDLPSGTLELAVEDVQILNTVSQKMPFLPGDDVQLSEETRLRNRILDLRYLTNITYIPSTTCSTDLRAQQKAWS